VRARLHGLGIPASGSMITLPIAIDLTRGKLFAFGLSSMVAGTVIAIAVLFAVAFLLRLLVPKLAAIASTTTKEGLSQPLFYLLLCIGAFLLLLFVYIPYNTFGEDTKVYKDQGLTLIMVMSVCFAVWTASVSIAEEIEGRTALTLLSKPIGRRQFILGKFLGVIGPVFILFVVLGALFLGDIPLKLVYDARESVQSKPTIAQCGAEIVQLLPGMVLAFLETLVLTSIAVAISTRLPILANLVICGSIYVLGHLGPLLVSAGVGQFEMVPFVGQLLATILPVLDHFNIYAAISAGKEVPWSYVGWATLYCGLYTSVAMLVALLLFEDRDLA
jgi:ABC-type transport system involved in multi-copper enzyme maturation permease subunit